MKVERMVGAVIALGLNVVLAGVVSLAMNAPQHSEPAYVHWRPATTEEVAQWEARRMAAEEAAMWHLLEQQQREGK